MKYRIAIAYLTSLVLAGCASSAEVSPEKAAELESRDDLLSMKQGAVLRSFSSEWDGPSDTAFHVFDDRAYTNWSSAENKPWNNKFDVELQSPCRLTDIFINNEHGRSSAFPEMLARTVRVMASATSPDSDYVELGEVEIPKGGSKLITLDKNAGSQPYKWLRFNVVENWGDKDSTQLFEIQAYGTPVVDGVDNKKPSFKDGVFGGTWWPLKFESEGNVLFGSACKPYKTDEGMLGSIQGNQARVFMPSIEKPGVAIFTQSADGEIVNILHYSQFKPGESTGNLYALLKRDKSAECNPKLVKNVETLIGNYLEHYHKAILYGIDFKPDSAELTPESDSILNAVVSVMKSQPKLRLSVEAHNGWTDSNPVKNISLEYHDDSIEAHNKLSEARANAVVDWLSNHEIERSRLVAKGWGKEKPIKLDGILTPRQSLILNRRVEFVVIDDSRKEVERFGDF